MSQNLVCLFFYASATLGGYPFVAFFQKKIKISDYLATCVLI